MEPTHELDVLGHYCPVPVSQARKALTDLGSGDVLMVLQMTLRQYMICQYLLTGSGTDW